jgi:hypothetical protein
MSVHGVSSRRVCVKTVLPPDHPTACRVRLCLRAFVTRIRKQDVDDARLVAADTALLILGRRRW